MSALTNIIRTMASVLPEVRKPKIKQTGAETRMKDRVCKEGSHCPKTET